MTEIRFDYPSGPRWVFLVSGGVCLLAGALQVLARSIPVFLIPGALFVSYFFLFARFGATMDATGVRLHGFSTKHVPWQNIQAIEKHSLLGGTGVWLRLVGGGTKRLRAPVGGLGFDAAQFEADLATIQQWWRHYTGQPAQQSR